MNSLLDLIRILSAIIAPLAVIVLASLIVIQTRHAQDEQTEKKPQCVRCGTSGIGAEGTFHYTESVSGVRGRTAKKQLTPPSPFFLGSETHFVCDACAQRYLRNEIIQLVLMAIAYPIYRYLILPAVPPNGFFANFLIETLLIVLTFTALTAAFDLYRATREGKTPLSEARDRVAIGARKNTLGKKFSFYTEIGAARLGKLDG